jgi:23S rRNA pseudouridine1911/1915/1917 synthase
MAVFPEGQGREAVTYYQVLEQFDKHAYLEVKPETGRTHQIRVHLAFIGIPIAGDRIYGRKKPTLNIRRHFLHAAELRLLIPGETSVRSFLVKLAPDLETALKNIRR